MDIKHSITTVDTHTEGGPTRIVTGGVDRLVGATMAEKMEYFKSNFDHIRRILMLEPRGYKGMFGAVLTEPADEKADVGVIFLTGGGYLNMCVHSAIGVATACLETGVIKAKAGEGVTLDTPAGLITLEANYVDSGLESMTIRTNPAFVQSEEVSLEAGFDRPVRASIVFSAVYFAVTDAKELGLSVRQENIAELTRAGLAILETANENLDIEHPSNPTIKTVELAMLYEELEAGRAVNAVISRAGSLDRSPCGAGTGAKMAYLYSQGKLGLDEEYVNESIFGTKFTGRCIEEVRVGSYKAVVPKITGSAYVTGMGQFVVDGRDSLSAKI